VHYYCNNEEGIHNQGTYPVCSYYRVWHHVNQDEATGEPRLGEPAQEVHAYNCEDKTESSSDEQEPDPVNNEIRHSAVTISPSRAAAPSMSMTRTAPAIGMVAGGSPVQTSASIAPTGTTPTSIQSKLNAMLWWTGPPSRGGGLGGPGGPGEPGRPGAPGGLQGQAPQQPVTPAGDMKTMGQLPQVFTDDQALVDNFIKEVKGYLHLNQDVTGFDSPIKKTAFTLMLIKGADTAGWTHDMGDFLNTLDPRDNIPELWMQFLKEFGQQF
jgi:hypothetical protein